MAKGGILAFDDYGGPSHDTETAATIDAFFAAHSAMLEVIHKSEILILRKRD